MALLTLKRTENLGDLTPGWKTITVVAAKKGKYDGEKKQGEKGGLSQYYADLSGRKEGIEPAQMEVHFIGSDAPEGLCRIKDQLIKVIPS